MKFLQISKLGESNADSCIIPLWQKKGGAFEPPAWAKEISKGEFGGASAQMALLRNVKIGNKNFEKALMLGMGEMQMAQAGAIVANIASAFCALKQKFASKIAIELGEVSDVQKILPAIASQIKMADYSFEKYIVKDEKDKQPKAQVQEVQFICAPSCAAQIKRGEIIGNAANYARSLQNEPSNIATPSYLASRAKKMAGASALSCKVLGKKELSKLGMNAMLAVASGSAQEPALAILEYRGNPSKKGWDCAFVGKGVTFDSGGISIKPSRAMDEMKFDKSGACAVMGAMSACKSLDIKKNIVGICAFVENMPSGTAYKPGDIVRACNGKTIEVLNTDAEGRVVLADALAYAQKTYSPQILIDIATLTGACVVALGDLAAGIMCDDEKLCEKLIVSSNESGERLWPLPTWAEYDEKVKSEIATVKNIGESGIAGPIAGYSFLKPFAGGGKWAHIDIAGVNRLLKPKWGLSFGGTGFGVRLALVFFSKL